VKSLARPGDKADVLRRLRGLKADSARRWGRMSAPQMVCHLSDSFRCVIGLRPVSDASTLPGRTVVKWIALYLPLPWPGGRIRTRPEIDALIGGTKPADFAADVADLEGLVELVTSRPRRFEWCSHPIFGRMTERDWMRWGYLHMDHHLRQFGA
jgi:hypothetical protein